MIKTPALKKESLFGCPDCDLLVKREHSEKNQDARCPRCGALLSRAHNNSINRTFALSLSGLFLFLPACLLPLLSLNILGHSGHCTMLKGVLQMKANGYVWMSFLVLFCSVVVPVIVLGLLAMITGCIKMGFFPAYLVTALKMYQKLSEWTMLDVYMISILIALIKMKDFGDIFSGPGLYCFAALLGMSNLAMVAFEPGLIWELIERHRP